MSEGEASAETTIIVTGGSGLVGKGIQAVVERLFHGDKLAAHKARIAIGDALRDPGKFDPRKVETQSIDFDDPREWKK